MNGRVLIYTDLSRAPDISTYSPRALGSETQSTPLEDEEFETNLPPLCLGLLGRVLRKVLVH